MRTTDFLVVGGGILGLTLALDLKRRYADSSVTLLEKESGCGLHASGRNSGVLHAGFYYSADTLKARLTCEGNAKLAAYCVDRNLPLLRCGKLVVAKDADDLPVLEELQRRGAKNGVVLELLTADEVRRLEPHARTHEWALFSPDTATVSPTAIIASLARDADAAGITILTGTAYRGRAPGVRGVLTSTGTISVGYLVNAAGLYADRVARDYGFSERYCIMPFRGQYLLGEPGAVPLRMHIYPVPKLGNPFLGVHFTRQLDGTVKIGPSAMPAFWREHYGGLRGFSFDECMSIAGRILVMFARNPEFRRLALAELADGGRSGLLRHAASLVEGLHPASFGRWGRTGIRAQLYDLRARRLEMDFRYEGDQHSFHVLNAVSPAFTCALPLAAYFGKQIEGCLRGRVIAA